MTAKLPEVRDAGWSLEPLTGSIFCFRVLCKIKVFYYYYTFSFPPSVATEEDVFCKDPERELARVCCPASCAGRQLP